MFFLATCDAEGNPQCSYKGGDPGFVRVVDDRTLAFPVYDGNGMFLSLGNIRAHAPVGLLFIDFESRTGFESTALRPSTSTTRCCRQCRAPSSWFVCGPTKVFPNCSRYIHKMQLVERSKFVPREDADAPIPDWKRMSWAQDYLPEHDPARAAETLG